MLTQSHSDTILTKTPTLGKSNKLERPLSLLFVLYPILDIYGIGIKGISIGKLAFLIYIIIYSFKYGIRFKFDKYYAIFLFSILLIPLLMNFTKIWFSFGSYLYKAIGIIGFAIVVCFCSRHLNITDTLKIYRKLLYISISLFFLQEILFFASGYRPLGIVPFLPLADAGTIDSHISMQESLNRSCSFFLEPSHFVYYIGLYYIMTTLKKKRPFHSKEFWLLTLTLIFCRSGNGYIIIAITILSAIVSNLSFNNLKRKALFLPIYIIVLLLGYKILSRSPVFEESLERSNELVDHNTISSGSIRTYAGYFYISSMDKGSLLWGISPGNLNTYYDTHDMYEYDMRVFISDKGIYLNSIQQIIAFGGIFSLFTYLIFIFSIFRGNNKIGKTIIITLLVSNLISSNLNGYFMLISLIVAMIYRNSENERRVMKAELEYI